LNETDAATPPRILVVEDDPALSSAMCEELTERGLDVRAARTVADAFTQLATRDIEVCFLDLRLPDGDGMQVLRHVADEQLPTEVIVLTGFAEVETAVAALRLGAYDYLTKPARLDEIELLAQRATEKARLRRENVVLKRRIQQLQPIEGIVTEDPGMQKLLGELDRVAGSELPVLVTGETGSGKELIARAVHRRSPRAAQPFVAVNCAALSESLLESELFGHEKGSFTGALNRKQGLLEIADRGVLFLDEIGEASPSIQAKLLRALETREFYRVGGTRPVRSDVRIVSATNRDLRAEASAGRFREDLYFRLGGVTLRLPPLRERPGDVVLLAQHVLDGLVPRKSLSRGAAAALQAYPWPGNVRELQMVIRRAALLAEGDSIQPEQLPSELRESSWVDARVEQDLTLEEVEVAYIKKVLERHGGHRGKAAKTLGIDPKTLYNKLGSTRPKENGGS
jgi:two-component system, NtrC family, response regulator AtoC